MRKTVAIIAVLLLAAGCAESGSESDAPASLPDEPSVVERVVSESESSSAPETAPPKPQPPSLEQPEITADEAQILLVPDSQGLVPIHTPEDLMALAALVNSGDESHGEMTFVLQKNINLSGIDFIPIGGFADSGQNPSMFLGAFDGDGHRITNLTVLDNGNAAGTGLFGYIGPDGSVANLHLVSGNITGPQGCGSVGGVAGRLDGSLSNCSFNGVITADGPGVGGLVGEMAAGDTPASISQCFVNADVTGAGYTGGLVGRAPLGTAIADCYALGEVNAVDNGDGEARSIGGFAGEGGGQIARCFSNNEVYTYVTAYQVGGFLGSGGETTIDCYYNQAATENWKPVGAMAPSEEDAETGITQCTVAQLVERETYVGWDFTDVWEIDGQRNRGLPFLRAAELG